MSFGATALAGLAARLRRLLSPLDRVQQGAGRVAMASSRVPRGGRRLEDSIVQSAEQAAGVLDVFQRCFLEPTLASSMLIGLVFLVALLTACLVRVGALWP